MSQNQESLQKLLKNVPKNDQERFEASWNIFNAYYEKIYGEQRWNTSLLPSLCKPTRFGAMINPMASLEGLEKKFGSEMQNLRQLAWSPTACLVHSDPERLGESTFPTPAMDPSSGVWDCYYLDPASLLPVQALDLKPGGERILDLCSAPGGKSLATIFSLYSQASQSEGLAPSSPQYYKRIFGKLTCNEASPTRRSRLKQVLDHYLVPTVRNNCIQITGVDGTKKNAFDEESFDKVLVDAPCSSDRHVLQTPAEMMGWSAGRTKNDQERQVDLVKNALKWVVAGGTVVYSTCSLSPTENDDVIGKIMKKSKIPVQVVEKTFEIGEKTKHGWIVLPDRQGFGPIFVSVLKRLK